MKRVLIIALLILSRVSFAQLWSGIVDPSRAVTWQGSAGFPGGTLPDTAWTQSGSVSACGSVGTPVSAATCGITAAIAACGANQYVSLGAGNFYLTSPINISVAAALKNNCVLRGQGANSTFLIYSGASAGSSGGCYGDVINLEGSCFGTFSSGENNVCLFSGASTTSTVTGGTYLQGSTYLSVTNCGGTTPALGSLGNLAVGGIIIVDQLAETVDTGTIWNCAVTVVSGTNPAGCAGNGDGGGIRSDGVCNGGTCERPQSQGFKVIGISGSTVQVDQPLYLAQWRTSQQPQAWFPTHTATNIGVENLSIDTTSATGFVSTFNMLACNGCWVAGVRSIDSNRSHVRFILTTHSVLRDSYFYKNQSGSTSSYGMEIAGGWYNLIENNITQNITDSQPSCTGSCSGNVLDYNFDVYSNFSSSSNIIVPPLFLHAGGDTFNLWEGNIAPGFAGDNIHGTHHFETVYRNTFPGWQSVCGTGTVCKSQTIPITLPAGDRYFNIIGNVLGQAGYHTTYNCVALTSNTFCPESFVIGGNDLMIYWVNYISNTYSVAYAFCNSLPAGSCTTSGNGSTGSGVYSGDWDVQNSAYLMRWGNYDTVTAGVRWCGNSSDTGWSTNCAKTLSLTAAGNFSGLQTTYTTSGGGANDAWVGQSCVVTGFGNANNNGTFLVQESTSTTLVLANPAGVSQSGSGTATCTYPEVPTALASYSNAVPTLGDTGSGQSVMPPSFFYNITAKPSGGTGLGWWKNPTTGLIPKWPPMGPDVTSGILGNCSGGTYAGMAATASGQCTGGSLITAWGGLANATPAAACYLSVMSGPPDGTGSVLAFNPANCYANDPVSQASPSTCTPGSGTYTTTQTPSCTNPNSGTTVQCYSTSTTPATNGLGTGCTTGTSLASGGTVSITTTGTTLEIIAGTSTLTDSTVNSYTYTLQGGTPTASPGPGAYTSTQTVTLTSPQSQSMCYTINGTTPASNGSGSCTTGSLYSTALTVSSTETIKAIGMASGFVDSAVGTFAYTINAATSVSGQISGGAKLSGGASIH